MSDEPKTELALLRDVHLTSLEHEVRSLRDWTSLSQRVARLEREWPEEPPELPS
jgi:hypothetical protein